MISFVVMKASKGVRFLMFLIGTRESEIEARSLLTQVLQETQRENYAEGNHHNQDTTVHVPGSERHARG